MVGLWVPRYESTRYGCSDVAGHWVWLTPKCHHQKLLGLLICWDSRWFEMISFCLIDVVGKFIEMIFRSREISLKYVYIKISPLISSFPWWNLRLASGTFGICICANELRICWAWLTHLPATALQQADQMVVVGWLGEGIPLFEFEWMPYFRAMSNYHYATMLSWSRESLLSLSCRLHLQAAKHPTGVFFTITPFTSLWDQVKESLIKKQKKNVSILMAVSI